MDERKDAVITALTLTLNDMVAHLVNVRAEYLLLKSKEDKIKANGGGDEHPVVTPDAQMDAR